MDPHPPRRPPLECSFCAKAHHRRDDCRRTHLLRDRQGNPSCPFLKVYTCTRCYRQGHAATHCTHPDTEPNLLAEAFQLNLSLKPNPQDDTLLWQRKLRVMEHEDRVMAFRFRKSDFYTPKECSFCKNGKYPDEYFKTHHLANCPRLACIQCPICQEKGHTYRFCPQHQALDSNSNNSTSIDSQQQFIFDFDEEQP